MSLKSNESEVSYITEERVPLSCENSSRDVEELSTRIIERKEDVMFDQNLIKEISNIPDFIEDDLCEESFSYPEESLKHSNQIRKNHFAKKEKNSKNDLNILGKNLFFTFIFCVLVGIFAFFVEQRENSNEISNEENSVEKSLIRLFNNKEDNFDTKEIKKNEEVNFESSEKLVNIPGGVIKEKNESNETDSSLNQNKTTENESEFKTTNKNLTNSSENATERPLKKEEKIDILREKQEEKIRKIKRMSPKSTVESNEKIMTYKINGNSENKARIEENKNKLAIEIKPTEKKPNLNNVKDTTKTNKNDTGNIIPEPECSNYILEQRTKYGELYQFSVNRNVFRSNSYVERYSERMYTKIIKKKYAEAVDLLEVVHNIDPNGKIVAQDTPCESGEKVSTRIQENIQKQTDRLNKEYQMDSYFNNQLRFCLVVNSYNNAHNGLIYRNKENNGKFYGGASDTAMMMPMLEIAFPRIEYVPELVYEYRFDTGQVGMTVNKLPQAVALKKIGSIEPYESLVDFSFVDDAINKAKIFNSQTKELPETSN